MTIACTVYLYASIVNMPYKLFFASMIAMLGWIFVCKYYPLVYYWFALITIVSILNYRKVYKKYALFANSFFFIYICFITWVRTRNYSFTGNAEWWLNNWEHLLFAVVVCLLVSLFIRTMLYAQLSFIKTLLYTICIFKIIGVGNEYFQNVIKHRTFLILTEDSQKDLLMNVCGTVLFTMFAVLWHTNKQKLQKRFSAAA